MFYRDHPRPSPDALKFLHGRIIDEHRDFSGSYPIAVRSMVFDGYFNEKVMKNYFVHVSNHPWKTREEFLDRQAEYFVYVQRKRYPRTDERQIREYRDQVRQALRKEDEEFNSMFKKVTQELDKETEDARDERRQRLLKLLSSSSTTSSPA